MIEKESAVCRGCGTKLIGNPYYMGGNAYLPNKAMDQARVNFYGGFVCSRGCDIKAARELEGTMPGCRDVRWPMAYQDRAAFERKWEGQQ
jgi:hypothetical protein